MGNEAVDCSYTPLFLVLIYFFGMIGWAGGRGSRMDCCG